ncbi:MAG: hypothetical protein RLP44_00540 [Aggregatilineales bacterium]
MAIDYIIGYDCIPKQTLTPEGILERLKGEQRALKIIDLFRKNGDDRPPSQMGFEFTRNTPEGVEETQVIVVQELLDEAAELHPLEAHCLGCPANRTGERFGCMGFIEYPISRQAESWLLDRLPVPDEPLIWLLLKQGVQEFQYDGGTVKRLRADSDAYFEERMVLSRRLGEFSIDANQLFEMIFAVGNIQPNHAALLLLFMGAINRDLEADTIMHITPPPPDVNTRFPFILTDEDGDDKTILELKAFFRAMYMAWSLNVPLKLDV